MYSLETASAPKVGTLSNWARTVGLRTLLTDYTFTVRWTECFLTRGGVAKLQHENKHKYLVRSVNSPQLYSLAFPNTTGNRTTLSCVLSPATVNCFKKTVTLPNNFRTWVSFPFSCGAELIRIPCWLLTCVSTFNSDLAESVHRFSLILCGHKVC